MQAAANGITLEYDVHGDDGAPVILLVEGLGAQLIGWPLDFVQRFVERGFRVVRFDNRDVGMSTKIAAPVATPRQVLAAQLSRRYAHAPYLLTDMADDAVGLLDALGIERCHLVGASMGGMIAQTMAIRHPARVASLVSIMSNTGDRRHGRVSRRLLRKLPKLMRAERNVDNGVRIFGLVSGPHYDTVEARTLIEEALARSDDTVGVAHQAMAIAASPDRTFDLRRVTAPTLVIHGLVDPLVLPSGGMATARAIRGSRLIMYPDMGHDLPRPRWDEIVDEIVTNARRAEGGSAGRPALIA